MKRAIAVSAFTGLLGLALLASCVTVNVYFPAAQAQQAADKVIDAVTGSTDTDVPPAQDQQSKPPNASGREPPSSDRRAAATPESMLLAATGHLLEMLVPAAAAQEQPNLNISTPEIRAIIGSLRQRYHSLKPFAASGAIGFTADGTVAVRDPGSVPLAQRATLTRLVAQQNQDLAQLYSEIAKANGHPEWAADIRNVFAQRWRAHAHKRGLYYRDSGGNWARN